MEKEGKNRGPDYRFNAHAVGPPAAAKRSARPPMLHPASVRWPQAAIANGNDRKMTVHARVAPWILDRLQAICLELPEVREEQAWVGTRWRVRSRNFAHVLVIDAGWPPAYAKAAGSPGPRTVLTFRSGARLDASRFARAPFFKPVWWPDIAGLAVDAATDWDEVADLVADSYCLLAPKKLAALVDRPADR
jgi:hypothetical protein